MKQFLLQMLACALTVASVCAEPPQLLEKANVLPLSLDDDFEFRKAKLFFNDPRVEKPTTNQMLAFERQRINFGAVTQIDRQQRYGHYFTFFWRTHRPADLTIRLEYRQENLGALVQARELRYPNAKGSQKTDFAIIGDDYLEDGKVTAWRAVLIENGRIVALNQSFLWN
jgi:hypothetical protein